MQPSTENETLPKWMCLPGFTDYCRLDEWSTITIELSCLIKDGEGRLLPKSLRVGEALHFLLLLLLNLF